MDAYNAALKSYNNAISAGAQTGASTPTYNNKGARIDPSPNSGNFAGNMPTLSQFQTGDAPPSFTSKIEL